MGKTKRTKKFGAVKRTLSKNDDRLREPAEKLATKKKREEREPPPATEVVQAHSSMFFSANQSLKPPYRILLDTNFINMTYQNKCDSFKSSMDLLLAKCIPHVTDCVIAELEKMGSKYRMALQLAKDPRVVRLTCQHKGTYADDCLCQRVTDHKCYIVATNDKDLKKRIRKIPGVPIMFCKRGQYGIERIPDQIASVPANISSALKSIKG